MRPRFGLSLRRRPDRLLGRLLLGLLALATFWYALMALLLSVKVAPSDVNAISGYRSAYHFLATLTPSHVDSWRGVIAAAAVLLLLVLGTVAIRQLPTPARSRHPRTITRDDHGTVTISPLVVERLAEIATGRVRSIGNARASSGPSGISVAVSLQEPRSAEETLHRVQRSVTEALQTHELDLEPVSVVLARYQPPKGRQLQ